VGTSNELAAAAARAAAEFPGEKYNPVFLHSPPGLGKTHLLHAAGHRALERGLRVLYVSSDRFVTEFVTSIREGRAGEFRERYRRPDVLLMDDVQFLSGKEQTQEGLFHIFNELHHSGRQVVLASDRPPRALKPLDDRLRSRFEWGLIADIQPPDLETRMAILRSKAASLGANVPADVLEALARYERRSVRELEGSLNRLSAYADLTGRPITLEVVERALGGLEEPREPVVHTADGVIEQAARLFGTTAALVKGPKRERTVSHARHLAMYVMREDMGLALTEIGRALGGRDHSTVYQAIGRLAQRLPSDATLQRDVAALRAKLGARAA
ncbi:MAG: chromosomal replication initiator protein DnaA, partial [Chloroflexota bacterium]|nr:chromosomal replication initiator protein DnaA [Chloroflexota bacterium]